MRARTVLMLAAGAVLVASLATACADPGNGTTNAASAGSTLSELPTGTGVTTQGVTIDWSNPIVGGITTSLAAARAAGSLSFSPTAPSLASAVASGVAPTLAAVQVTNPAVSRLRSREIALIYQFPIGADFPRDGRVVVQEREDGRTTVSILQSIAASQPGVATMITLGQSEPALLFSDGVGGRVIFVRNGVNYDITGPDVSKSAVVKIANVIFTS